MNKKVMFSVLACLLAGSSFLSAAWQPEKRAVIHKKERLSASLWLWPADKPVADGAVARFRYAFDVKKKVKKAFVRINYDDSGNMWINGKTVRGISMVGATREYDVTRELKQGRNLVAVVVRNGRGSAGMLLYGEIHYADGSVSLLHSTENVKSVTGEAKENWQAVSFDDSKWGKSRILGDVTAYPWIKYRPLIKVFMSDAEKKSYYGAIAAASVIPDSVGKEKFVPVKVVYEGNFPYIQVGNERLLPFLDLVGGGNKYADTWLLRHRQLGMRLFQIGVVDSGFLRSGKPDFSSVDRTARRTLNLVPDAKFCLSFRIDMLEAFCKKYPEETIGFATGPADSRDVLRGRPLRPSVASEKMQKLVLGYLKEYLEFVKKQPWANRVVMVRLCYGIYAEWHNWGMYHSPDTSKPMTAAFRLYLKKKYKTAAALRKAWNNPAVTFETAAVPGVKERWGENRALRDPRKSAQTLDFYEALAQVTADWLISMSKTAKEVLPGRLCGAWYGYALCNHPPEGATVLLDRVASSPYVDFLSCPPSYNGATRLAGGDYLSRLITSTFRRYGKLNILEDDSRFHHVAKFTVKSYTCRTPLESQMTMRRNIGNMIFEQSGLQFNDVASPSGRFQSVFDDPAVLKGIKEGVDMLKKAQPLAKDSGNDIAVVFSYMERLRHFPPLKSFIPTINLANGVTIPSLFRSGFTFDLMSDKDFLASNKKYKTVIFVNAFTLNAAERKALKAKVRRKGTTAVYLFGAGYVTPEGFSTSAMEDLTGIRILADDKGRGSSLQFGFNKMSIPGPGTDAPERFVVADPAAKTLGIYLNDKKCGAAVKTLADGSKAVFIGKYLRSEVQWYNLLRHLGNRNTCAPRNYARRHGDLVMFHTGTKGSHRVRLPEKYKGAVDLFTGRKYSGKVITVDSAAGPGTWVFKCY